jgi:hypothetical protein
MIDHNSEEFDKISLIQNYPNCNAISLTNKLILKLKY